MGVDEPLRRLRRHNQIEAAFADAELGLGIADLHQARPQEAHGNADPAPGPDRIRIQSAYLHTPVLEAFDALHTPTSTVADNLENM
ncbi:hypothetical protein [Streptomyces sp. NPDC001678]|uniref:hypothetical protein n=1 Tax=Streptomyces sp. NPDC001678 TaxID=3364599 RepID=UPI00367B7D3A